MIFTLTTSLCLLRFVAGAPRAVCQTIEVVEGEDALFLCRLDPPVNLSAYTLDVKRDDNKKEVVHAYRYGRDDIDPQTARFRGRTTLDHKALARGVIALMLSSVSLSDNGVYQYFVPRLNVRGALHLIVVPREQQNRTERRDSSTAVAPVEEEPESADGDAAKNSADWKIILGGVVVVVFFVVVVLLLLWKREAIKETFTGTRRTTDVEMVTTTRQTEADEGRRIAAGEPMLHDEDRSDA